MGGIRAELTVESPGGCPVAQASAAGGTATSVTESVAAGPDEPVTEEFVLDRGPDAPAEAEPTPFREVFAYGDERVYRFDRPQGRTCFCACIERFGCPVRDVRARDGRLTVAFHAPDEETLRKVVSELDDRWSAVSIRRLLRSHGDPSDDDPVLVDRSELTDRQREVLETAHEMGYFEHPKGANAGEVAAALDLHPSTVTEHLAAAQGKLLASIPG